MRKTLAYPAIGATLAILSGLLLAAPATAASNTYYVDAVAGSDTYSGTSSGAAWKSLDKVNSTPLSPGDHVLLKAGDTWTNQFLDLTGSGTATAPIVVDSFGTGPKPIIDFGSTSVGSESFGVRITDGSYWDVNDLEITSGEQSSALERNGILVVGDSATTGTFSHIHITDNDIHDIFGSTRFSGGINVWARANSSEQTLNGFDDVLIEDNTVKNVSDRGIQTMTDKVTYGTKDGIPDSWYTFTNLVVRRNTVTQINGDGILPRGALGSLIESNTTDLIGADAAAGANVTSYMPQHPYVAAQWAYYCKAAIFQHNVASRTKKITGDGEPWDFDIGVYDSVYQYNYSYDNQGGTLLSMYATSGNVFRYNISQNDGDATAGAIAVNLSNGGSGSVRIYNNVFYRTSGQTKPLTAAGASSSQPFYYLNNIFWGDGSFATGSAVYYSHNTFYGANSAVPSDPAKLTTNPSFVSPGAATGWSSANDYALTSTSPSRDSGIATASDNGGLDFTGHELYQGAGPDRGAIEYVSGSSNTALLDDDFDNGDVSNWTVASGSWRTANSPSSFGPTLTSGYSIAVAGTSDWTDYSVSSRVAIENANGNGGLLVRYSDDSNYDMLRINANTNSVDLYQMANGTLTLLRSSAFTPIIGTYYTLRVDVRGTELTTYLNGVLLGAPYSTSLGQVSAGKVGLRTAGSTASFDDVVVVG